MKCLNCKSTKDIVVVRMSCGLQYRQCQQCRDQEQKELDDFTLWLFVLSVTSCALVVLIAAVCVYLQSVYRL